MQIRYSLQCLTCNENIIVRVSIGHGNTQTQVFHCPKCSQEIKLTLDLFPQEGRVLIEKLENAQIVPESEKAKIINLAPEIPIKNELANMDYISPTMLEMMKIMKDNAIFDQIDALSKDNVEELKIIQEQQMKNYEDFLQKWNKVNKLWHLYKNNKLDILIKLIPNISYFKNPIIHKKDFFMVLWNFLLQFGQLYKIDKIMEYSTTAMKNYPKEYLRFLKFVTDELTNDCINDFYEIFLKFFDNYCEYKQVEIYALGGLELEQNYNVTSFDYYKTDMFYGQAYEKFTKYVDILALLFNVYNGRDFKQFKEMDYDTRYINLDKANKCNPFKDVSELYEICKVLYSGLRNASHHGDISFVVDTHMIKYTHGRETKHTETMTYAEYLKNCYDMLLSCSALLGVFILHRNRYIAITNNIPHML